MPSPDVYPEDGDLRQSDVTATADAALRELLRRTFGLRPAAVHGGGGADVTSDHHQTDTVRGGADGSGSGGTGSWRVSGVSWVVCVGGMDCRETQHS